MNRPVVTKRSVVKNLCKCSSNDSSRNSSGSSGHHCNRLVITGSVAQQRTPAERVKSRSRSTESCELQWKTRPCPSWQIITKEESDLSHYCNCSTDKTINLKKKGSHNPASVITARAILLHPASLISSTYEDTEESIASLKGTSDKYRRNRADLTSM